MDRPTPWFRPHVSFDRSRPRSRGSTFVALSTLLLVAVAPSDAAAQAAGPDCIVDLRTGRNQRLDHAGDPPLRSGQCYGDGQRLLVPSDVSAHFETPGKASYVLTGSAKMVITPQFYEVFSGAFKGKTAGRTAECGLPRRVKVARDNRLVEAEACGTEFEVRVNPRGVSINVTEGEVRVSRAMRLEGTEAAGVGSGNNTREQAEPRYFEQLVSLSPGARAELNYSLTEDSILDLGGETCVQYFKAQLDAVRAAGMSAFYVGEAYRNIGDCHFVDGDWAEAAHNFDLALESDLGAFGEIDPDVADDYRALGEVYLEWASELYKAGSDDDAVGYQELAEENLAEALRIDSMLSAEFPDDLDARAMVAEDHRLLGDLYLDFGFILYELEDDEWESFVDHAIQEFDQALAISRWLSELSDEDFYYFGCDYALDLLLGADAREIRAAPGDAEVVAEWRNRADGIEAELECD